MDVDVGLVDEHRLRLIWMYGTSIEILGYVGGGKGLVYDLLRIGCISTGMKPTSSNSSRLLLEPTESCRLHTEGSVTQSRRESVRLWCASWTHHWHYVRLVRALGVLSDTQTLLKLSLHNACRRLAIVPTERSDMANRTRRAGRDSSPI